MAFPAVRTVSGDLAVIYTTKGGGSHPIHGAYLGPEGVWYPSSWTINGYKFKISAPHPLDITLEMEKLGLEETEQTTESSET